MCATHSQEPPVVFISYSHDSSKHMDRVLALANRLRSEGVDCNIDQYEDAPKEAWPKWMDRQIENADFVLVVCTERYLRRVSGKEEAGKGLGVRWESTLAYQDVYDAGAETTKYIPVIFEESDARYIPKPLKGQTNYRLKTEDGYERLYRRLTRQPKTVKAKLGKLKSLPAREMKRDFLEGGGEEEGRPKERWPVGPTAWDMGPDQVKDETEVTGTSLEQAEIVSTRAENEYRAVLKEELGTIKMLGSPDVPNVPVDLLDTFVSLDITAMSAGGYREGLEPSEMRAEADRKLSPESALKRAFEDHRMLLVLGDPGSGKTTLVKYYAMLCLKNRHKKLGFKESPLPIYLPLREVEVTNGRLCPLHECLAKWASRHYLKISADTFFDWLQKRPTLILLDGLDEISELNKRQEICDWIDSAATGLTEARFVVTSRWTGYRKADGIELEFDHAKADVRDFSEEQQKEFLEKWFVAAYQREPRGKGVPRQKWRKQQKQKALDRAKAIVDFLAEERNKGIRELAVVPMLLQVIAILWRERENLPQGRADLYQAALKYLLDFRDRHKKIEPLMPATQALRVLCPASFWMQDQLHSDEVQKDKLHGKMQEKLANMKDSVPAGEFCKNLQERAGLIADYGKDAYIFRHKSFREYLAGLELVTQARETPACLERIVGQFGEDWWNEPLRFFMCEVNDKLFDQFMGAFFNSNASRELNPKSHDLLLTMVREAPERQTISLTERLNAPDSTENQRRYIIDCLKAIGSDEALKAIRAFGEKEAQTGAGRYAQDIDVEAASDLISVRDAVKVEISDKPFRNPFELNAEYIRIPGGSFEYSVTKQTETVSDIYFARYPLTNKRYRRFIDYLAGREKDLGEILSVNLFSERILEFAATVEGFKKYLGTDPKKWAEMLRSRYDQEKRWKGDDQPVVTISWFAARAYCFWLTQLTRANSGSAPNKETEVFRLPEEVEWEWAASGGIRAYPWGDKEPDETLANYGDHVGATTPVGRYPEGGTPEGLMDMAGNVWEWMENQYQEGETPRSLRGGSWLSVVNYLRCSYRVRYLPDYRYRLIGFRVVLSQS